MKRLRRLAADAAGNVAAAGVWTLVVLAVAVLAAIVGLWLLARHACRVALAWPQPVESRSDREARLLDPHRPWLDPAYDMDAELAALIAQEEARQRRFPSDSGSVRGWLAVAAAIVGGMVCAVASFIVFALGAGGAW